MPLVHLMLLTTEIQIRIQILISMSKVILSLAAIVAVVALFWPFIEENFINATGCPWPFDYFHGASSANETSVPTKPATTIKEFLRLTPDELRAYDGSDESKYLLMAVDGKILDVESGAKFYRKGATYNVFAGRTATRALSLASLEEKDINDVVSDFNEAQNKELKETIEFYTGKYPIVGEIIYHHDQ